MQRALIYFTLVLCVLLALLCIPANSTGLVVNVESVVLLRTDSGLCSGFIAARGIIATAGHCIHPLNKVQTIIFVNGETVPYKVLSYIDACPAVNTCAKDWALVMADTKRRLPVTFARTPKIGSITYHVGHPQGISHQILKVGTLLSDFGSSLELSDVGVPGESGSPVFDSNGRVFGMETGYFENGSGVSVNKLHDLLHTLVLLKRGVR